VEPIQAGSKASSMMDVDPGSSPASSVMGIIIPIPISSEDEDTEEKIIKEAENKISKSSTSSQFKGLPHFASQKSPKETLAFHCICVL
jgi:hypothetical protein